MTDSVIGLAKLPADPQPVEKAGFPVVTCIAPLVMGCVLFAVTRSPMMLLFVLLSPALAIASTVDQRVKRKKAENRRTVERAAQIAQCRTSVRESHRAERNAAWQRTGRFRDVLEGATRVPSGDKGWLWFAGTATLPSTCPIGRERNVTAKDAAAVIHEAARVSDMPLCAPIHDGIRITGAPTGVETIARSLIVQAMAALPNALLEASAAELCGVHAEYRLPNVDVSHPRIRVVLCRETEGGDTELLVAFHGKALDGIDLPIVSVNLAQASVTLGGVVQEFQPAIVSRVIAARHASDRIGLMVAEADREPPERYALGRVRTAIEFGDYSEGLIATCAADANGAVAFDLVIDGPHAAVGGTTGSGKSEFLRSWALSLADRYSPAECALLLIDFKGGATFDDLGALPHSAGLLTDLDDADIARAIESLRAELRERERTLREHGVPSIDRLPHRTMPRLVIMVDEFQAMLAEHPDLHRTFVDIAARGRSLGVHLVLCTQRPAAAARDALLANCSLRISLRVNNAADSRSLLDDDAAAEIPRALPGRLCFTMLDGTLHHAQGAYAVENADRIVQDARESHAAVSQIWLPRLTAGMSVPHASLTPTLAWLDLPAERRREAVTIGGRFGRAFFATGGTASGLTTLGRALLAQLAGRPAEDPNQTGENPTPIGVWVDSQSAPSESWAALGQLREGVRNLPPGSLIVIDDIDEIVRAIPLDYQEAALDRLAEIVKHARQRPIGLLVTAHRVSGGVTQLAAKCDTTIRLRTSSKADFVIAGGPGAVFDERWPVGAGAIESHRMQAPFAPAGIETPYRMNTTVEEVALNGALALMTSRGGSRRAGISEAGLREISVDEVFRRSVSGNPSPLVTPHEIAIGTPAEWGAKWGLIGKLRETHVVLVDGCGATDLRTHLGENDLPPLLDAVHGEIWQLRPGNPSERRLWSFHGNRGLGA